MNKLRENSGRILSFNNPFSNIIPWIKSMVFFIMLQSWISVAGDWKEYIVKQDENAWRIVFNQTKSYKIAANFNLVKIRPGDIFLFSDTEIKVTRNWKTRFNIVLDNKSITNSQIIETKSVEQVLPENTSIPAVLEEKKEPEEQEIPENNNIPLVIEPEKSVSDIVEELVENIVETQVIENVSEESIPLIKTSIKREEDILVPKKQEIPVLDIKKEQEISYDFFMSLPKEVRFHLVTKEVKDWYYEINFPNKELANKVTVDDIIPDKFWQTYLIKDKENYYIDEKTWKRKLKRDAYFNVLWRDENWVFHSLFSWKKYKRDIVIIDWYLIKPFNQKFKEIKDHKFDKRISPSPYNNEIIIKNLYWSLIRELIEANFPDEADIYEDFFYSIIARESAFDPNAISPTNTRWLWMITRRTIIDILLRNTRELEKLKALDLTRFNWDVASWDYSLEKLEEEDYNFIFVLNDFIPVWRNISLYKDWEKHRLKGIDTKLYLPETSIPVSINYLRYLRSQFSFMEESNFKRQVIAVSYNAGPWIIKYILKHDKSIKDIDSLIVVLKEVASEEDKFNGKFKGILTLAKVDEVEGYVKSINRFHEI